jgi:hypothetical protein
VDNCTHFVASESVRSHARWSQYPWFSTTPEQGRESIASGIEIAENSITHLERWLLFQSGQFVHHMAFDDIPQLGERIHVLEILDMTTALFEFVGRMAERDIFTGRMAIAFELKKIAGRQLTWPGQFPGDPDFVGEHAWSQDDSFAIDKLYTTRELLDRRRILAFDAAVQIYSQFGWNDIPTEELRSLQHQRFGPPRTS